MTHRFPSMVLMDTMASLFRVLDHLLWNYFPKKGLLSAKIWVKRNELLTHKTSMDHKIITQSQSQTYIIKLVHIYIKF